MRSAAIFFGLVCLAVSGMHCKSNDANAPADTPKKGTVHISVDESFKPIIDAQIDVFQSLHPGSRIIAHYKPEAECIRDFAVDSIRMVIATRGYTPSERKFLNDSMKVSVTTMVVAYDAIAVILHPSATDTTMTIPELKDLLTGRSKSGLIPVFDGRKATSTVRFIMDSLLKTETLAPGTVAANSSSEVIDYVARTPNAVGLIGVSWVGNPQDTMQLSYLRRIRVAGLEHPLLPGIYTTPAQFNIFYRRYPLVRDLTYVLKEKHNGLGHGFADFLTTQSGQLIFNRSFLVPAYMKFNVRDATLSE